MSYVMLLGIITTFIIHMANYILDQHNRPIMAEPMYP